MFYADGHVGTYLRVSSPGVVRVTAWAGSYDWFCRAQKSDAKSTLRMTVGDETFEFSLAMEAPHAAAFMVKPGTHLLRLEFREGSCQQMLIHRLAVWGATVANDATAANAIAAAETYAGRDARR